jgi:hypothetical protein
MSLPASASGLGALPLDRVGYTLAVGWEAKPEIPSRFSYCDRYKARPSQIKPVLCFK